MHLHKSWVIAALGYAGDHLRPPCCLAAVEHGDVAVIVEDYREDAVLLTSQGAVEGRSGLEMFYTRSTIDTLAKCEVATGSVDDAAWFMRFETRPRRDPRRPPA